MDASVNGQIIQVFSPDYFRQQMDLDSYEQFRVIVERIKAHRAHNLFRYAVSFGKDSKLTLLAGLEAHIELVRAGIIEKDSPMIVTNIDTGVEDIFVKAQVAYEKKALTEYCMKNDINLVFRSATPSLRYTWSVMYLSGMKLPSFAKSSADCSVILKIDPAKNLERALMSEFGEDLVTVLGVRNGESTRRSASIKRHGMDDVTIIEKEINGKRTLSLAPIIDLDTDDVFSILRRAGDSPIVETQRPIPCYTKNNALLIKLYGDAQDTCPVSSFQAPTIGAESKRGSCGNGSRFGCYTCLKVVKDKSADARKRFAQYRRVDNVSLIRDWVAHTSEDMSLRASVGKSTCPVTDSIVIQSNTYNAQTLEKLIYWFAQATREDALYAENFSKLVAENRLMEDPGYVEILNDDSMDEDFKAFYLDYYVEMSQTHLIQPLTLEQIMLICAIHARDGVDLPPYRALWIWNEVMEGRYIPWPVISGESKSDPVPEPRFFFGDLKPSADFGLVNPLGSDETSCSIKKVDSNDSGRYITEKVVGVIVQSAFKRAPIKHAFTKRKLLKKKGGFKKTRMSVQFSPVEVKSAHVKLATKEFAISIPTKERIKRADIHIVNQDDALSGIDLNRESLDYFMMTDLDRCLEKHNDFVKSRGVKFGGIGPFLQMVNYGVISLTERGALASEKILNRTNALSAWADGKSLLSMSDDELAKHTLSQTEYRTIKASILNALRKQRHQHKRLVRDEVTALNADVPGYILTKGAEIISGLTHDVSVMAHELAYLNAIISTAKFSTFDGIHLGTYRQSIDSCMLKLNDSFGSIEGVLSAFGQDKAVVANRAAASKVVAMYAKMLGNINYQGLPGTFSMLKDNFAPDAVIDIQSVLKSYIPRDVSGNIVYGKKPQPVTALSIFGF